MNASCSLAEILVDDQPVAKWGYSREPLIIPREVLTKGEQIAVRVIGSPNNLFGAFHDPHPKPGIQGNQFIGAKYGPVPGNAYTLNDCGLFAPPQLRPLCSIPEQLQALLMER